MDIRWQLFLYHIQNLTDEELYWCFHEDGLQVHHEHGEWRIDWPEHEDYSMGNLSIAWTLWHIKYWWTKTIYQCFYHEDVEKEAIKWNGSESMIQDIIHLHDTWIGLISDMKDEEMQLDKKCCWQSRKRVSRT